MSQQLFKHYIQIIGKGQRSGRTLTQAEAYEAMSLLLNGHVSAEQRGAFLMLLRVREETGEEIAGFLQACREHSHDAFQTLKPDLDMSCYAGKRRHLPWLILSMLCLVENGYTVFLHGTDEPDTKRLYVSDALTQLGFKQSDSLAGVQRDLTNQGFAYADLSIINPPLDHLIKLRAEFGLRSCANTLARMLNPSQAAVSMQGVYHRGLDKKHAHASRLLNDNACVFRGDAGELEVNPERDCELLLTCDGATRAVTIPAANQNWSIKPRALDIALLRDVWRGSSNDAYGVSACLCTLSAMLIIMGKCDQNNASAQADALWKKRNLSFI